MDFNFGNLIFGNLIKSKKNQILDKTSDAIQESEGFKVVFAGLKAMIKNNAFNDSKVIKFSESDILNLKLDEICDFDDLFKSTDFAYYQILKLNNKLEIVSKIRERLPENSGDARIQYTAESNSGEVIFLLIQDKINYFIKGIDKSESTFFSLEELNNYNRKKNITEINEVFTTYQEDLKDRKNYCKFFIELSHLKSLHKDLESTEDIRQFIIKNKHVLRNKPEDTFRDDLRKFLSINLRISQVKEYLLENMKRLDIFLFDEYGSIYLIEVKWVGESIHPEGKKIATKFATKDINPAAITQALDYLDQLDKKKQNIVRGYLVVFDARKDDEGDTVEMFDEAILNKIEVKNYRKFEKLKDLRVINFHPS